MKNNNGYLTKFMIDKFEYHSDFPAFSSLVNILNPGTEDVASHYSKNLLQDKGVEISELILIFLPQKVIIQQNYTF